MSDVTKDKWELDLRWHNGTDEQRAGVGLGLSNLDLDTDEGVGAMLMHLRASFRALYRHMCQKFDRMPNPGEMWEDFEERTGISMGQLDPPLTFAEPEEKQ